VGKVGEKRIRWLRVNMPKTQGRKVGQICSERKEKAPTPIENRTQKNYVAATEKRGRNSTELLDQGQTNERMREEGPSRERKRRVGVRNNGVFTRRKVVDRPRKGKKGEER